MTPIELVILGEPASKANSREVGLINRKGGGKRVLVRKSDKALGYEASALRQIPTSHRVRLEGPVAVWLRIFYASNQPDLDESIVLDVMQDRWKPALKRDGVEIVPRVLLQAGIYRNDRQVQERHVWRFVDAARPRAEIRVVPMRPQQASLSLLDRTVELEFPAM